MTALEKLFEGDSLEMTCANDRKSLRVPSFMIDDDRRIKTEYRHRNFGKFYASPCGFAYCSAECWSNFCSD